MPINVLSISETLFTLILYSIYWPAVRLGNKVIINLGSVVRALEYLMQTRSLVFVIFPLNEIDHYMFLSRARCHKIICTSQRHWVLKFKKKSQSDFSLFYKTKQMWFIICGTRAFSLFLLWSYGFEHCVCQNWTNMKQYLLDFNSEDQECWLVSFYQTYTK